MSKSRIMAIGIAGAAALGAAFLANNFLSAPAEKQIVEVNNVSMTPSSRRPAEHRRWRKADVGECWLEGLAI
jgi:hypothetical protein